MNEKSLDKSKFLHDILLSMELNTAVRDMLVLDSQAKQAVSKLTLFVGTEDLNKLYVFAVEMLGILYENNPILSKIYYQPIWKTIKILDDNRNTTYTEQQKHINELRRIWILEKRKNDIVELNSKELKFLEKINNEIRSIQGQLSEAYKKREKYIIDKDKIYFKLERYDNYALYINGHYLVKPHDGSIGERIMERCLKRPNQQNEITDLKAERTIVATLNDMGFNAKLRKLFFPSIRKTTILLRPIVTGKDIIKEQIDISDLKDWL